MQARIQLIHEINCYVGKPALLDRIKLGLGLVKSIICPGFGSVWITADPCGLDDAYEEVATRLTNPLPDPEAGELIATLRSVLTRAGVEVLEYTVADD